MTPVQITSTWQRFSVTATMGSSATSVRVFLYNPTSAGTLHVWGAQLENSASMNSYNQTTSLPVRVANPNWGGCHVWISQDNSEYHQIGQVYGPSRMGMLTGTASTRSNLLLNSNGFNTGSWGVDGRATLTPNNATGPDGMGTSASTLSRGTATLGHASDLQQSISANANISPWTFSIWARTTSGTQQIQLVLDDVTTTFIGSSPFTVTTTWQRFSFSCAAGALVNTGSMLGGITILPGTGAGSSASIQIFGAQLEKTSAMTPYIPTTSSTVTVTSLVNSGADPDPTNYFPVDFTQSAGVLQAGTQADADSYRTLCYAGGEFISFQGTTLTGSNKYNVGQDGLGNIYLRRGLFGSNITTHNAGEPFARLDDSIFTYVYDPSFIGKTLYLKFTSFNTSGLMEQSIANATAYQFLITGRFLQNESISKNMLDNPGFECNASLTPASSGIQLNQVGTIAYGQRVGDAWTAYDVPAATGYGTGNGLFSMFLEQTSGLQHSGGGNLLVRLNQNVNVSNNNGLWRGTGVRSDYIPVKPGESYAWGGWVRWDATTVLPANTSGVAAIRMHLFDNAFNCLGELNANNAVESGFLSINSAATWKRTDSYVTIPSTFGGARPQYAVIVCLAYILNNTGAAFATGTNNYLDARFDDVYCFPQWSPVGNEIDKKGSISNTYTGGLTYTSTTNSITWSWNLSASRTDSAMTVNNYSGSQTITGLSAGTTYNFYPFIDEINQVVSMVTTGGVGSPSWAHNGTSIAWTQEQARGDHFPLSSAPMTAATTTSGTGGGGGGGVGGSCVRDDVLVHVRSKGVIAVRDLAIGDWVSCPRDEDTPDGWVEVIGVEKSHISREWVHTFFNVDDWLATTPGHPFTLEDGSMKRAAQLNLEDEVPCVKGITYPVSHTLETYCASKISITVRSARHVFYAGMKSPCILQHNILPVS